mgnify:CR=1 FL=1
MPKREIRILGLSAPRGGRIGKSIPIVGIIYRGSLWLDGILVFLVDPKRSGYLNTVATSIKNSKHYSQIRAVILSRPQLVARKTIRLQKLATRIRLPVFCLLRTSKDARGLGRETKRGPVIRIFLGRRDRSVLAYGIGRQEAESILRVACAVGTRIPEAVRTADLIANRVLNQSFLAEIK